MQEYIITDCYNSNKEWIIKVYDCHHYYLGQKIQGRLFGKIQRSRKNIINGILQPWDITIN